VADRFREQVHPLVTSHGATAPLGGRSRFRREFDWCGTFDPSAWLSVPAGIRFGESLLPGGWREIRGRNHDLAITGRSVVCSTLGVVLPCPDAMIGSMAAIPLPDTLTSPVADGEMDPLQESLWAQHQIEVPVIPWPTPNDRVIRISAQVYNTPNQYHRLASALRKML
jgi:isopenicillin-N epimerase